MRPTMIRTNHLSLEDRSIDGILEVVGVRRFAEEFANRR